jgi:hypothetical protein
LSSCAKCGEKFGHYSFKYNSETVYKELDYTHTLNAKLPNNPYWGKNLCKICYQEVYENAPTAQEQAPKEENTILLQCKNAALTNSEFRYKGFEVECLFISDMKMAIVENNGSLGIILNDGAKKEFKLSATNWTKRTLQWASAINMLISKGKRVQVVLDFSSLKDVMAKGGIVMTAYKCPVCNGKLEIPEVGKVLICSYCGTPIKPVDIFEKIKDLIQ